MNDQEAAESYHRLIESRYEKLKNETELRSFFYSVEKLRNAPSFEEKEFLVDSFRWGPIQEQNASLWVAEAIELIERIDSGVSSSADVALLFIRLDGVLDEFLPYFNSNSKLLEHVHPEASLKFEEVNKKLIDGIVALRACYTELEKTVVEFLRHQNCHVFLKRYSVRLKKDGAFARMAGNSEVPRILHMDEIVRVMNTFRWDYQAIARVFGDKGKKALIHLRELLKERDELGIVVV